MTHYVCTGGCGGVSETPGNCQTQGCSLFGRPLKPCNCSDGKHQEAYASSSAAQEQQTAE